MLTKFEVSFLFKQICLLFPFLFPQGHLGLGEIFMHPNMFVELATTELKGQAMKPNTWQRFCASGRHALDSSTYNLINSLMETDNGRYVLSVVFVFIGGVVLDQHPEQRLPIEKEAAKEINEIFCLPNEYRVSKRLMSLNLSH